MPGAGIGIAGAERGKQKSIEWKVPAEGGRREKREGKGNLKGPRDWRQVMKTNTSCPIMSSFLASKHGRPDRWTGTVSDHGQLGGWAPKDRTSCSCYVAVASSPIHWAAAVWLAVSSL
jgi:hypothetical protein